MNDEWVSRISPASLLPLVPARSALPATCFPESWECAIAALRTVSRRCAHSSGGWIITVRVTIIFFLKIFNMSMTVPGDPDSKYILNAISKQLKELRGDSLNVFLAITNTVIRLLQLPSLETRRLQNDLIWCYKIVFGHTITHSDFFEFRLSNTHGHPYKLF